MGETNNIEKLHNQLLTKRKKIEHLKKIVIVIIALCITVNLFTLFFNYKYINTILKTSIFTIIFCIILSYIYIQTIRRTCKSLKLKIYETQKLKI